MALVAAANANANIAKTIQDSLVVRDNCRINPDTKHGKLWVNQQIEKVAEQHLHPDVARTIAQDDLSNLNIEIDERWASQFGFPSKIALNNEFLTLANNGGLNFAEGPRREAIPGTHVRFTRVRRDADGSMRSCAKAYICDLRHCVTALGNAAGKFARTILIALLDSRTTFVARLRQTNQSIANKERRASDNYNLMQNAYREAGFSDRQVKGLPMRMTATINNRMMPNEEHTGRSGRKRALQEACGFSQDQVDDEKLRDVKIARPNGFGLPFDDFVREAVHIEMMEEVERRQQNGDGGMQTNRNVVDVVLNAENSAVARSINIVRVRPDGTIRSNAEIARLRYCHVDDLDPAFTHNLGNAERVARQRARQAARNLRRREERQRQRALPAPVAAPALPAPEGV